MTPKPLAVFTADFPDDQIEDDRDIVLFGGRNVIEAISQIASGFGCETSGLLYEGEKGWSLDFRYKGATFAGLVSSFHPQFFLTFYNPVLFGRLSPSEFADFWEMIDTALRGDGRIHDLQWYELDDAPAPWEGLPAPEASAVVEPRVRSERRRLAQTTARTTRPVGCLVAFASMIAVVVGGMKTTSGVVALLMHKPDWPELLIGSLILLAGGFGVWRLYRRARAA